MRHRWLLIVAIVGAQAAQAAPHPVTTPGPANPKVLQAESRRFAQQMNTVVDRVVEKYVRVVSREDLLEAAIEGLFQAARKPVPRDLRSQIQQAVTLTSTLRAQSGEANPKITLASSSSRRVDPVERMLARLRTEVGEGDLGNDSLVIACRAMAKKLDPYSGVVTAEEQRRMANRDQETIGVGLECRPQVTPGPYDVEGVHAGSPAQRAGLRPGDVLTHLDGLPAGKALPESILALRSRELPDGVVHLARPVQPGAQELSKVPERVKVTYRRGDEAGRTVELIRERYRPETVQGVRRRDDNSWDYVLDAKARIAHIRVGNLNRGTSDELREVLASLGEEKIKGIILDLRWCPGGYLNEAVEIADLFLGEALVATVKSRGEKDVPYRSTSEGKFRDFTVVVLVNSETSGGAELIAAALRDHDRASIVGQRTLGKASVQTPIPLGMEGTGFKLTSGTFIRPSGKNLHRFPEDTTSAVWGVVPDEDARLSLDLGRRLKQWWQMASLRPASSNERLALDDPRADPQQQAALAVLRKKMK